jgi:hypothetical protein
MDKEKSDTLQKKSSLTKNLEEIKGIDGFRFKFHKL